MAEESTKKRGRLAAAVIAGSTLAFGSFAMGIPAALADEEATPPASVSTQEAAENTAEPEVTEEVTTPSAEENGSDDSGDAPASVDGEDAEPDEPSPAEPTSVATGTAESAPEEVADTAAPLQENEDNGEQETVIPSINLDASQGTPGSAVNISGMNFEPGNAVEISLESASSDGTNHALTTVNADDDGQISVSVTIPEDAALGEYYINAVDEAADTSCSVSFSVVEEVENEDEDQQLDPLLYVNPRSGPAGSTITLSGPDFTKNGDIEISVTPADGGDAVVSGTFTADESGWLTDEELAIPEGTANGLYDVTAVDIESDEAAETVVFNVTDVTLKVAPETISEEDFQDTGVTLTVDGLEQGDVVNFDFGSAYSPIPSLADSATADESGIAEHIVQPTEDDVFVGNYSVNVSLAEGDIHIASGSFEVTSELPQVSASPQEPTDDGAVLQGELLNVSAYNVTPDNSVTVDYGIDGVDDEQLETDADGYFFTKFEVPEDTEPGVKELTVTDDETRAVGTAEYTVAEADDGGEVTEPTLTADRDQILLEDFVGAAEDEPGVHFTVEGLEVGTEINYAVESSGNLEDLEGSTSVSEDGKAAFFIYGFDWVSDPSVYLGDYSVTVTYVDESGDTQELGPEKFSVVEELTTGPQISLESHEVYQGGELDVEISNLTPDGEVEVKWNPTETMTADAQGRLETELAIADDAATGAQTLTVTDVATGDSNSVEYTVLEAAVVEPALTIDPERITLEKFVGEPEDGAGVAHVVNGLEPGAEITYMISGPEYVNDYESSETADDEGIVQFVIHGYDVSDPAVYLGEYNTVVTYTDEDGDTATLSGTFTVIDGASSAGGSDGSGDSDAGAPAGPADINGYTGLAQTGATGMPLGFLAGGLLLVGAAFVAYANRARLFGRKN